MALAALASDMMIGWSGTSWDDAAGRIDDQVEINVKDAPKASTEQLIEKVISGVFSSIKDVAAAAKEAVGGEKVKPETT